MSTLNTAAAYSRITSSGAHMNPEPQEHSQTQGGPSALAVMPVSPHNRTIPWSREIFLPPLEGPRSRGGGRRT